MRRKKKPDWMFQRPSDENLRKAREWNGTNWHWCSKETGGKCDPPQYRAHKPSQCKGTAGKKSNKERKGNKGENLNRKVTIKEAIQEADELQGGYETD